MPGWKCDSGALDRGHGWKYGYWTHANILMVKVKRERKKEESRCWDRSWNMEDIVNMGDSFEEKEDDYNLQYPLSSKPKQEMTEKRTGTSQELGRTGTFPRGYAWSLRGLMTNSKCPVTSASMSHGSLFSAHIPSTKIAATNTSELIGRVCLVTVLTHIL